MDTKRTETTLNRNIRDTLAKTGASIVALVAAFACVLNIFNHYYNNGAVSPIFVTGFISLIFAYAWLRPQCSNCTPVINWMFTLVVMVQLSHSAVQGAGYGVATMVCLFVSAILMFTKSPRYGTVVLLVSLAIMNINVNLIWENMVHEHYTAYEMTMYNIVAFMTWAVIYRLTGIMWDMHERDRETALALSESKAKYAETLRQLEVSIEGGQIGVFTHYLNTNIMEVNNHYRTMRNLPLEGEITFEQATQYMKPLDESLGSYDDVLVSHRDESISKTTVVFDDGVDRRYQRLVSAPIRNDLGELVAMTGTVFDITEEYEARSALEESQAKQEEFSAHLEESMAELEEKREQEKQMLAVLGHELRTPASMLKMLVDDLSDLGDGKVPKVKSSIDHLINVLDDLKAISNPQVKLLKENESLNMCNTMDSIVEFVKPIAEGTNFTFDYTVHRRVPYKVKMSEQALRQIMTNLVKNAVKHSGGDHVSIDLANRVNRENNTVISVITVSDNGRGIPFEERATIFEPFIRGKQTRAEGTGLGLSIIKGLLEQYNGTIEYQPNPKGKGAMFVIQMELDICESETTTKYNSKHVNMLEGKKILVAEDNLTIQMLTKAMLEKRGATVITVNNGREGIELLGSRKYFNIIISDIFMPEMEGYEFVTMARAMGFTGPIIGATAAVLGEEIERMVASGADVCLEKPLNVAKLNKELARLLS